MKAWQKWRRAILGTIGAVGIWIAAILATQTPVEAPSLPVARLSEHEWVLTNDYSVAVSNVVVVMRTGFRSDFCSIPPPLQHPLGLFADSPSVRRGGLAHDGMYALMDTEGRGPVSKDMADACLELNLLRDGTDPDKARAMREAVSLYGFTALQSHTPESVWNAGKYVSVIQR